MVGRVDDKVICITRAASGIGRGVAIALAKEGGTIMGTDLQDELGASLVAEIKASGGRVHFDHTITSLYDQRSTAAADGRGLNSGEIFTADGALVMSCVQESMLRRIAPTTGA